MYGHAEDPRSEEELRRILTQVEAAREADKGRVLLPKGSRIRITEDFTFACPWCPEVFEEKAGTEYTVDIPAPDFTDVGWKFYWTTVGRTVLAKFTEEAK